MKKQLLSVLCLLLAGVMLFSVSSCGFSVSAETIDWTKDYTRTATETGELTDAFIKALADFSMDLFKSLVDEEKDNHLVSPLSAVLCLALILNGADGETKAQMEAAFQMDVDTLNRCLYTFVSGLYSADHCKVNIANSIWIRNTNGLTINEEFLQANADWYDAQAYSAPFDDNTLKDINNWCKHYTDGMIDKILDKLDPSTMMILINALSFDAEWATKYEDKDVVDYTFHNYDGSEKLVSMLSSEESIYLCGQLAKGFCKNYAGNRYSIVCLLPDENVDIYDYINSLNGQAWTDIWASRKGGTVIVKMPEFSYSADMVLNDTLEAMGMTDMFSGNANFSKMSPTNLCVSRVCQKTFIKVDRNGTKAAAITWGEMKETAVMPTNEVFITLDRPFVYAIVDNDTGLPLFVGALTDLG